MPVKQVSARYIEGIKEGRKLFNWWKHDGTPLRQQLEYNIEHIERVREKISRCAYSAGEVEFFDGELDFYRNQLKKLV